MPYRWNADIQGPPPSLKKLKMRKVQAARAAEDQPPATPKAAEPPAEPSAALPPPSPPPPPPPPPPSPAKAPAQSASASRRSERIRLKRSRAIAKLDESDELALFTKLKTLERAIVNEPTSFETLLKAVAIVEGTGSAAAEQPSRPPLKAIENQDERKGEEAKARAEVSTTAKPTSAAKAAPKTTNTSVATKTAPSAESTESTDYYYRLGVVLEHAENELRAAAKAKDSKTDDKKDDA